MKSLLKIIDFNWYITQVNIPNSLSSIFNDKHFATYPKVLVPQNFVDDRGSIKNIADGKLGDVAVITSKANSIRANHIHDHDWHLSYLVSGSMKYYWSTDLENSKFESVVVNSGEMIYTPPKAPHKMVFLEDSVFIAISELSRVQENYEADTNRLPDNFFV
jgi:uncharacterized RmlC-like cupin family protein